MLLLPVFQSGRHILSLSAPVRFSCIKVSLIQNQRLHNFEWNGHFALLLNSVPANQLE